jgi:hypothetical protein
MSELKSDERGETADAGNSVKQSDGISGGPARADES